MAGVRVGEFTLAKNVWAYPEPPAEVGGIDGGPYLATWSGFYLWLETRVRVSGFRPGASFVIPVCRRPACPVVPCFRVHGLLFPPDSA